MNGASDSNANKKCNACNKRIATATDGLCDVCFTWMTYEKMISEEGDHPDVVQFLSEFLDLFGDVELDKKKRFLYVLFTGMEMEGVSNDKLTANISTFVKLAKEHDIMDMMDRLINQPVFVEKHGRQDVEKFLDEL